jgi:hypothetical protein
MPSLIGAALRLSGLLAIALFAEAGVRAEPVSFRSEVMAVLSKGGCNQGACHGNQNGKNGFKLSLRGEDPAWDLAALTRDTLGRRTNPFRPTDSLMLLKATATVPHEGGQRFKVDSPEYAILSRWIAEGLRPDHADAPVLKELRVSPLEQVLPESTDSVSIDVKASFSDGSVRDVTHLAVYEPLNPVANMSAGGLVQKRRLGEAIILVRYLDLQATVRLAFVPERPDFRWPDVPEHNYIDGHVFARLRTLRIVPSELCSDSVFVRRAFLDTIGLPPTAEEASAFLTDARADKRARLIDLLLQRPEFADFWALKWSDLLRNEEKTLDRKGVHVFHSWLRRSIAEGKPLNELARELVSARGSTYANPPANYYRALRDPYSRTEATAQVFLGLRLQCVKCHNHPFDRWKQDDYYGLAAFFPRVQYKILENNRRDRFDKHEFDGEQVIVLAREGQTTHPRTGTVVEPRFLGSSVVRSPLSVANTTDHGQRTTDSFGDDPLGKLADWIAEPDNPYFARTQANRIWFHLIGQGIVDPIDDFRLSNPPSNGPLLEALTKDFVEHEFDLRHLVRAIMNSRTYQLSSVPNDTNRDDETNFSHALVQPLPAEVLLDAMARVAGTPIKFTGYPLGLRAGQLPGVRLTRPREQRTGNGERFMKLFGKPERLLSCECERSEDATLGQALQLITGELMNRLLSEPENRLGRLLAAGKTDREIVDELYLACLSRFPSDDEGRAVEARLAKAGDRRAAFEDLLWGLLNAKEFLLRH